MIKNITLSCFRKHEALSVNLGEGLQTFKGANESGKTTILEGAAYALFGSKALRNSLADTVTWGHKESELTATVALEVDGKTYYFTRAKSGAEVLDSAGEVLVTGQNEVSNFAASLIGADVNTAHHMMLSSQGGLRGVLEQGPKATSTLIENLSDLDLIDRLIEAASEKLQLGSTTVLEDRLKSATTLRESMVVGEEPAKPDLSRQQQILGEVAASIPGLSEAADNAAAAFSAEAGKRQIRDEQERLRDQILRQSEEAALELAKYRNEEKVEVGDPAPLRVAIANAEQLDLRNKAYRTFSELHVPDMSLPAEKFKALEERVRQTLRDIQDTITRRKATIAALEPQVATSHVCPACGQDTAHLEHVKQKQAQIQEDLQDARRELAEAEAALPEAKENVEEIEALLRLERHNVQLASRIADYVTIDYGMTPAKVTWNGEVPSDTGPTNLADMRNELAAIEAAIVKRDKAKANGDATYSVIQGYARRNAEIDKVIKDLNLVPDEDFANLVAKANLTAQELATANGSITLIEQEIKQAQEQYNTAYEAWKASVVSADEQDAVIKQLQADIEATQFNNALVKKIRGARPIIANKLWNLVLSTVSVLFSQMRGEQSVVAKEKDGFTVNGKPIESLSGSTQDILGLAIRCALIKTFVPACPFLVLDEPSAACDADRSAALVGFVAGAGFKQIILVTHEEITESVSNNIVQL